MDSLAIPWISVNYFAEAEPNGWKVVHNTFLNTRLLSGVFFQFIRCVANLPCS